jgi:hypothetical protein
MYPFPIYGSGWFSVYGSEDNDSICRVNFYKAWVKIIGNNSENNQDDDKLH